MRSTGTTRSTTNLRSTVGAKGQGSTSANRETGRYVAASQPGECQLISSGVAAVRNLKIDVRPIIDHASELCGMRKFRVMRGPTDVVY